MESFILSQPLCTQVQRCCNNHLPSSTITSLRSSRRTNPSRNKRIRTNKTTTTTTTCSTRVPAHFNPTSYKNGSIPLDVDIGVHHIALSTTDAHDYHFIPDDDPKTVPNTHLPTQPVIDTQTYPDQQCQGPHQNVYAGLIDSVAYNGEDGERLMSEIKRHVIAYHLPFQAAIAQAIRSQHLSHPNDQQQQHPVRSCLLMDVDVSTNILRYTQLGTCAIMVIRDDAIIHRSYPNPNDAEDLIDHLLLASDSDCDGGFHTDFVELTPNDLIIAGSDGLFANLSDPQILAFVRPVPDQIDKTLALANNTCLGSWTSDDVDFISYYLANLANNFADAQHSNPIVRYPFPPSPHFDDITVLCMSCSFR